MDAIDKIIAEINEKAEAERQHLQQDRQAEIEAKATAEIAHAQTEHEKQLDKQLKAAAAKYKQLRSRQQVEVKQATLKEKQAYLNKLFAEAYDKMAAWDEQRSRDFAEKCLQALPVTDKGVLRAGGKMPATVFSEAWLQQVAPQLSFQLELGEPLSDQEYGFIVDENGVYYNFLYRDLLNEVRNQSSNEITQKLFN